ncbi:hypothetical protein EW146_g7197 [Bondarzewia mesenterica]|uniref:Uncharacterized protein n=1 Tax=Bondarzewia mesenterica TaxID=1095465 RepID=A0A4S4LM61_9AGAM|nr:hypothetical protein EW146_g7197 [Bondarzewia mesenterica]
MAKHARKRRRVEKKKEDEVLPLGARTALDDDASKDDEERRLESMLFGTPFVSSRKGKKNILVVSDESDNEGDADEGAAEFEGLLDNDLFFVDDRVGSKPKDVPELDIDVELPQDSDAGSSGEETDHDEDEDEDEDEERREVEEDPDLEGTLAAQKTIPAESSLPQSRKAPAWTDPDDNTLQVSLTSSSRLRKLRDAPTEDTVGGREYERRLRRQYEKIHPTPEWAVNARTKRSKRRRGAGSEDSGGERQEEGLEELVASTGGILDKGKKGGKLEPGVLAIERLRDANQAAQAEGEIKAIQFHPSRQVPVLLTASSDRRIRLFNIDGHTNPHLQTLHIPSLPVTTAQFHPSGSSILLTGQRPYYYTYDLQSGATVRSPRGLWGTTFNTSNPSAQDQSMEICAFNPTGDVLAVAGRRGYVHLVDWKSGAGQVVGSVKANAAIKSLWWARGVAAGARELMALGEDAEVYVWDVGEKKCLRRWKDDGGFGSRILCGDRAGKHIVVGSKSGIVNVYGSDAASSGSDRPRPLKAIENLTTSISSARFNHDSQLLAIASNVKKDQMRLVRKILTPVFVR